MRRFGIPLLVVSALCLWLGFAMIGGWLDFRAQIPGLLVMVLAVCGFFGAGFLLNRPLARGFLLPGLGLLADAYLIAAFVPNMINAGSGQDAVDLTSVMGSGVCVFLGLALVLAAALSTLISQK